MPPGELARRGRDGLWPAGFSRRGTVTESPHFEDPSGPRAAREGLTTRRLASASLFRGAHEVVIVHEGQEYRLRITKANKLILTK